MKTLLLNPPKSWNGAYICREEYGEGIVRTNFLPSQIYLAAAYLRGQGKDADALDVETPSVSFDDYDAVVVCVSVLHSFYDDIKWLKKAKNKGKKTIMILNKAHEGFELEAMGKYDFIDAAVRLWEREIVLDRLISQWELGANPDFPGVIYRKDGKLIDTGQMPFLPTLKHLTSCSEILHEASLKEYEAAAITPSRGCPMPHTLCMYRRSGPRRRSVEDAISEIETIAASIKNLSLYIIDPAMVDNLKWIGEFCNQLIAKGIKVSWRTDARLQHCLNKEILLRLKRAGCDSIMFYTPTLDVEIGKKIRQVTTSEELKAAVENIRKAGMIPTPVFEIGLPWDSDQTLSKIMTFLREVSLPSAIIRPFRPWKGTPLYEECKEMGLLKGELGIDDYVHSDFPILDTLYLSREEIEKWKNRIKRANILNPRYPWRFFREGRRIELRHFKKLPRLFLGKNI